MKRKLLASLLCAAMTATMLAAGCASSSSNATTATKAETSAAVTEITEAVTSQADTTAAAVALDGTWPAETIKIGVEVYDTTDDQFLAIQSYYEYLTKYYNISFTYSESLASAEDELSFIDSCASAGCKAIIGYYNVAGAEAVKETIDNGMYYWGSASNPAILEEYGSNDMYLGGYILGDTTSPDSTENGDFLGGYQLAYSLGEQGLKHVVYCSGGDEMGVPFFIDRAAGFEAGIAAAQKDGFAIQYDKTVDKIAGWPGTDDFTAKQASALDADYDAIAVSFNAAVWFQPVATAGKADSIKIATIGGINDTYKDVVQAGMVSVIVYDCEEVVFGNAIPLIINAATDNLAMTRDDQGAAGLLTVNRWTVTTADDFNTIYDYHAAGNYFVSAEDMAKNFPQFNPDASFQSLYDYYASLDLASALSSIA